MPDLSAPLSSSAGTAPIATPSSVDPDQAVVQELLTSLGPNARRFTPEQLADAALEIQRGRQQATLAGGMADTSARLSQRPDASNISGPAAWAPPNPITQAVGRVGAMIAQTIGDASNAIRATVTSGALGQQMTGNLGGSQAAIASHVASLGTDEQQSVMRGAAFLDSALLTPGLGEMLPVIPGVVGKAANYLLANTFGGAVYGSARPLDEGETRGSAIFGDAATFGLAGGAVDAVGATLLGRVPWTAPISEVRPGVPLPAFAQRLDKALNPLRFWARTPAEAIADGGQLASEIATGTVTGKAASPSADVTGQAVSPTAPGQAGAPLRVVPLAPRVSAARTAQLDAMTTEARSLSALPERTAAQVVRLRQLTATLKQAGRGVETAATQMPAAAVQQAMTQQAVEVAAAHTTPMDLATPDLAAAIRTADDPALAPSVKFRRMDDAALEQRYHDLMDRTNVSATAAGEGINVWVRKEEASRIYGGIKGGQGDIPVHTGTTVTGKAGRAIGRLQDDARIMGEIEQEFAARGINKSEVLDRYFERPLRPSEPTGLAAGERSAERLAIASEDVPLSPDALAFGDETSAALASPNPDAHFASHVGEIVEIPPATQLPPLTGDLAPGAMPSLNIAQSLQFIKDSEARIGQVIDATRDFREKAINETLRSMGGQAGFVTRPALTFGLGVGSNILADKIEDEHPGLGSLVHTIGNFLEFAGIVSVPGEFWARKVMAKNVIGALDASVALSRPGEAEAIGQIRRMLNYHQNEGAMLERQLTKTFGPEGSPARRALAYIGGPNWNKNAHWESLNPEQQQMADALLHVTNEGLGRVAQAAGLLDQAREHYMTIGFNSKWYDQEFRGDAAAAVRNLSQTGGWAKHGTFPDLSTAEEWLSTYRPGIDPEKALNHDGVDLAVGHYRSVMRALDNKALTDALLRLDSLQPKEALVGGTTSFTPNPDGWRDVDVPTWSSYRAPDAVATLLENMARGPLGTNQIGRAYDMLSSLATRMVIYNRFIHGFNLMRRAMYAGVGPEGYAEARDAFNRNDPSILEWSRHGLDVMRYRFTPQVVDAIDHTLAAGGRSDLTTAALKGARWLAVGGEHVQDMIGSFTLAVANKEQAAFALAHPEVQPGSAAWDTKMQSIADYANDVGGRVPSWFRSPVAKKWMSRLLLAPQFLESRWNLMRQGSVNEPLDVINGGLSSADAYYGKFKLRQLLYVGLGTVGLSYLLSGKPPVFNPQTGKFYAVTGLKDGNGRDIGFDPWGEGQAEATLFSSKSLLFPGAYLARQVAPLVNIGTQAAFGRDYYGQQLSTPEAIENAFSNLGGIPQGAKFLAGTAIRAGQGQTPTVGEVARGAATTVGLGGFATAPNAQDAGVAAQAATILERDFHVPATPERVWELSRLMRSDFRRSGGQNGFGNLSVSYAAGEQRRLAQRSPLTWLWTHTLGSLVQ